MNRIIFCASIALGLASTATSSFPVTSEPSYRNQWLVKQPNRRGPVYMSSTSQLACSRNQCASRDREEGGVTYCTVGAAGPDWSMSGLRSPRSMRLSSVAGPLRTAWLSRSKTAARCSIGLLHKAFRVSDLMRWLGKTTTTICVYIYLWSVSLMWHIIFVTAVLTFVKSKHIHIQYLWLASLCVDIKVLHF